MRGMKKRPYSMITIFRRRRLLNMTDTRLHKVSVGEQRSVASRKGSGSSSIAQKQKKKKRNIEKKDKNHTQTEAYSHNHIAQDNLFDEQTTSHLRNYGYLQSHRMQGSNNMCCSSASVLQGRSRAWLHGETAFAQ